MFPVTIDEKMVILIGLFIIIMALVFRKRVETTFDFKKWVILLVLGIIIFAIHNNPGNPFPKLSIPILAMVGLFILIHF
ncbi:hypothetical protein KAI68_02110 [bacterium]|nr:hypothetical protein [bacterium]